MIYLLPSATRTRPNDSLQKGPAYVFHHLMKCGGTSVVNALAMWFNIKYDYIQPAGNCPVSNLNSYLDYKHNIENFYTDVCLTSHFQFDGFFLHQRYPEIFYKNGFRAFTFIREPLELIISLYYYARKNLGNHTLKDYIFVYQNFISTLLPCDKNNYKDVLDRYFFIGLTNKMQESMDKFADRINKKRIILPVLNETEKDFQLNDLSKDDINSFKDYNELDYKIYEYCLQKFDSQ